MAERQKPILGIRCAKCGEVYMAHNLAYPISTRIAEECVPVMMKPLNLKRRANLLYRLRKHGITADTKQRVIFIPYGESPWKFPQVGRLSREFYFNIQYIIT